MRVRDEHLVVPIAVVVVEVEVPVVGPNSGQGEVDIGV